jgi:ADP-L-glycero-D-manno-heptose 6-epimerase
MDNTKTILITGAAGFISSCLVQYLNDQGFENIYIVDDFGTEAKRKNWESKKFIQTIERYYLFDWLNKHTPAVDIVIHLGARTDTTEFNYEIHRELNYNYSVHLWKYCTNNNIPIIYASSAATYGAGELGYNDNHDVIEKLQPLNPYGVSKNEFDKWAVKQPIQPPCWAGLKFFNVYGPNEYHKNRMASVIWHSFNQIKTSGVVKLFKSHKVGFEDGKQLRDFVYVKDVIEVIYWMMKQMSDGNWTLTKNGLYNLGTGSARTFDDLVKATFNGLDLEPNIVYVDMPEDIRDKYQYFTEANMTKLREAGYTKDFYSLESGVDDYVRNYLKDLKYL